MASPSPGRPAAPASTTRRALHGIAELVMAGPQHRRSGTIRLRISPGGFATVGDPDLRVDGHHLVVGDTAETRVPLTGTTFAAVAEAAGVEAGAAVDVYAEGSGAGPDDPVEVDADGAAYLAECLARADRALRTLEPNQTPVLWPEHFDVGITIGEVNYGVSLGDDTIDEPYAYVGPWKPRIGEFWNVPFGAARMLRDAPDAEAVVAFFAEGRDRARIDPVSM